MEQISAKCTGCRTCEQICPKHCIKMVRDSEGFIIPTIDHSSCIDCGLCQRKCPQNELTHLNASIRVYAVRNKNERELYRSASGGAFVALASYMLLDNNAVVVGSSYIDEALHVGHLAVRDSKDLVKLQSSKYVQSDTLDTFSYTKKCLEEGMKVLYSGTPCQIAGLKAYLQKDYDNLTTLDLVCHGVPSPLLFEKYLTWLSGKTSRVVAYDFRDKKNGWGLSIKAITEKKCKTWPGTLDPYYYHFLKGNTYRECCYSCLYSRRERAGDISLGDYWGIGKEHPEFYSTKGVNCVLVNTNKGQRLFDNIKDRLYYIESTYEQVARHNENLNHPSVRHKIRDYIYDGINEKDDNSFFYTNMAYPKSFKARVSALMPARIMILLKKIKK